MTTTPIQSTRDNVIFVGIDEKSGQAASPIISDGLYSVCNYVWDAVGSQWIKSVASSGASQVNIQDSSGGTIRSTSGSLDVHVDNFPTGLAKYTNFTSVRIADPAAGDVVLIATVPANTQWRVKTIFFMLTANMTNVNRYVYCYATDASGNRLGIIYSTLAQPQSISYQYTMAPSGINSASYLGAGFAAIPIPEFILAPGGTISIGGFGIQTTDQFSGLTLGVEATSTI